MAGINEVLIRQILSRHDGRYSGIDTFVETGTRLGSTAFIMSRLFREVHTIELSEDLFNEARSRFKNEPINFHLGDSAEVLPRLAEEIDRPAVFFLDAHWYIDDKLRSKIASDNPFPLWKEIEVLKARPYADVIIVDDVHSFGRLSPHQGWSEVSLASIQRHVGERALDADIFLDVCAVYLTDEPSYADSAKRKSTSDDRQRSGELSSL